jgi:bacterioferritin (cytochrome b1)
MGNKAIDILKLDVKKLIGMLNGALSEEWLAYYQYWIGARLMEGPMRSEIEPELLLHANQELNHAVLVVDRIIQLRGKPVINPKDWFKLSSTQRSLCGSYSRTEPERRTLRYTAIQGACRLYQWQGPYHSPDGYDHPE